MKAETHPNYFDCNVSCSCGNSFATRSTLEKISIAICNMCHPFFTGTQKLVDTQGRVEKFNRRYGKKTAE